jgi:NitT/TauT family transport system substrate-binding protein
MLTKYRRIMQGAAILGTLLALMPAAGCSISTEQTGVSGASDDKSASAKTTTYKYGTVEFPKSGSLCSSPIAIAVEKGYFQKEGINPKLVTADDETRKSAWTPGVSQ